MPTGGTNDRSLDCMGETSLIGCTDTSGRDRAGSLTAGHKTSAIDNLSDTFGDDNAHAANHQTELQSYVFMRFDAYTTKKISSIHH